MRTRLVLTGAAVLTIGGGLWLWSQPAEEPSPFAPLRRASPIEAQTPESQRAGKTLPTARLPEPASTGEQGEAGLSAHDSARRIHDPIVLARTLLLNGSRAKAGGPASRGQRIQAFQRDLASLSRELRIAAVRPTDETLSDVRARLDRTRNVAAQLFPRVSAPSISPQEWMPTLAPELMRKGPPRRPAPPGRGAVRSPRPRPSPRPSPRSRPRRPRSRVSLPRA